MPACCRYIYVAEHKAGEGAETAGYSFQTWPILASIILKMGSWWERAAEETVVIMAAIIEPMQEIKPARGTAAQIDKHIAQRFRYCNSRGFEIRRGKTGC